MRGRIKALQKNDCQVISLVVDKRLIECYDLPLPAMGYRLDEAPNCFSWGYEAVSDFKTNGCFNL